MKKHFILSLLTVTLVLFSCKKDDNNNNNNNNNATGIQGTYKFKYITAMTSSTATGSFGDKTVTNSDYTTKNNGGTIVFDKSNVTSTGLTYAVDTLAYYSIYEDNDLVDSSSFPFTFTLPVSTSVAAYQLIGSDSIYFPQGSLTSGVDGSGSIQGGPSGGKYSLSGKLLTISQTGFKDSTFEDSGETIHLIESVKANTVMEKQ